MIPSCILVMEDESDRAFMTTLFQDFQRLMYREINKLVHDSWAAEDVLQTVLLRLIVKVGELRRKDRVRLAAYLAAAARNGAKNYLREKERRGELSLDEYPECADDARTGREPEAKLLRMDQAERMVQIWDSLDEKSRYLLEGRYLLEKTAEEMAGELGIKPDSLRMALTRARGAAYLLLAEEAGTRA